MLCQGEGHKDFPCHVGVVVDKKTNTVTLGDRDPALVLKYPYSDTSLDEKRQVYLFCAD